MQFLATALVPLVLASPALAQTVSSRLLPPLAPVAASTAGGVPTPGYDRPGSLLVFPEYDNRAGRGTFLTVTNTNAGFGTVQIRYVYVSESCQTFSTTAQLTARDTRAVLTTADISTTTRGFVYVYAESTDRPNDPISYNHLIGHAVQTDNVAAFEVGQSPLAFCAMPLEGEPTDLDADGVHDLDGLEYAQAPDRILVPAFFGQSASHASELILIGLSGGTAFTTTVDLLIYNDNEQAFSAQYQFACFERVPLSSISGVFTNAFLQFNTSHDPAETVGATALESGWLSIDGFVATSTSTTITDPAVLAFLVRDSGGTFAGERPFYLDQQDNGDLLPTSASGD